MKSKRDTTSFVAVNLFLIEPSTSSVLSSVKDISFINDTTPSPFERFVQFGTRNSNRKELQLNAMVVRQGRLCQATVS